MRPRAHPVRRPSSHAGPARAKISKQCEIAFEGLHRLIDFLLARERVRSCPPKKNVSGHVRGFPGGSIAVRVCIS